MKSIVTELITTCRTRLYDGQPNMLQSKQGDTCDVKTVNYINDEKEDSEPQDQRSLAYPNNLMFQPSSATQFKLMCSSNPNKEMNYLLNQEVSLMQEKKEMRYRDVQQKT